MSKVFRDCLNREIKVGDVIADGHRDGNTGGIGLAIVRGFTEAKDAWNPGRMVVEVAKRGTWRGDYWWAKDDGDTWRFSKTQRWYGERCFITGLTEQELRGLIAKATEEVRKQ